MSVTDLTGTTWILNNSIMTRSSGYYNINFTNNNASYTNINWTYLDDDDFFALYYGSTNVYVYSGGPIWNSENYKTIQITGGTDATNSNLISWLQNNATQQETPTPTPTPSSTGKIGDLPIIKKHFGSLEIIKEVLNGQTIYEAETPTPPTPTYPSKSDVVLLDLDGTGDKRYRVLKNVSGTTYLVVSLYSLGQSVLSTGSATYFSKELDTYLNTTWYNTLTTTAKSAIVSKYITVYNYSVLSSLPSNRSSWANTTPYQTIASDSRKVYALGNADIEEYFNGNYTNLDLRDTFNLSVSLYGVWLRDKANDGSYNQWLISYGNNYGTIVRGDNRDSRDVTASFQIDLSKINFTIEA